MVRHPLKLWRYQTTPEPGRSFNAGPGKIAAAAAAGPKNAVCASADESDDRDHDESGAIEVATPHDDSVWACGKTTDHPASHGGPDGRRSNLRGGARRACCRRYCGHRHGAISIAHLTYEAFYVAGKCRGSFPPEYPHANAHSGRHWRRAALHTKQ